MNQHNIFTMAAAACRYFYGKNTRYENADFPHWLTPVAGLIPGMIFAVFSAIFVLFMGPLSGGIMTAVFITLALELLTGWRGISISVAWFEQLLTGKKVTGNARQNSGTAELMQRQILFASIYIFRMTVLGILAAGGYAVWIVYVLGGAYLIRGDLLRDEIGDDGSAVFGNWTFYIVASVIVGILSFHWTALASLPVAVVLTLLLMFGSRYCIENFFREADEFSVEFLGYLSENIMFVFGLILFGRMIHG